MKTKQQIILSIILSLFFFGCVSVPLIKERSNAQKAWVSFGPEIEVINQPSKRYAWAIDQKGNIHFIIEMLNSKELQYVVVGQNGIVENNKMDKIKDIPWYSLNKKNYIDAAFDKSGNLHLIRDGEHFIYKEKTWEEQPIIPCLKFAKGWKDLICGYVAGGMEFESPGRLDWYMIGGYGGGLIWPWYSYPDKLVIVKKDNNSWFKPVVVDPDTKQDVVNYSFAADDNGNLYVLYTRQRPNIGGLSYSYIKKEQLEIQAKKDLESSHEDRFVKISGESIIGRDTGIIQSSGVSYGGQIAVDPVSGSAMFASESPKKIYFVKEGKYKKALDIELTPNTIISPSSAGNNQYHVLIFGISGFTKIEKYYLICGERECSAPILLNEHYNYNLISDGRGNSLLLLISEDKRLLAKWISVTK